MSVLAAPAFADGWRFVDGEAVWGYFGATDSKMQTREPVQRERNDIQRNPTMAGGWKWVGGEAGWLYIGLQIEARASTARASAPTSRAIR